VKVTFKLHSDAAVKTDSKAVIKFTGLMGQNFVAVDLFRDARARLKARCWRPKNSRTLSAIMPNWTRPLPASSGLATVSLVTKLTTCSGPVTIS